MWGSRAQILPYIKERNILEKAMDMLSKEGDI
jgi:hypothetical protein